MGVRRCDVFGCPVNDVECKQIPLHSMDSSADADVLRQWKEYCHVPAYTNFPKTFFICKLHFTPDCYTSANRLRAGSIPTVPLPQASNVNQDTPEISSLVPVVRIPPVSLPLPKKSLSAIWTEFRDLRDALQPLSIKLPTSNWVILDIPQLKPPKVSFEYLKDGVSVKSVTFVGTLNATVSINGNRHAKADTTVQMASDLESLLATVDELSVMPCGCIEWGHITDFEHDLPKVKLPFEDWFASSLIKRQYQIVFLLLDDHGRSDKCLSFSLNLLPRLHIRNERCLENDEDFQEAVKCAHDVERLLEKVEKLKVCSQTDYLPPAKADSHRKACQLVVPSVYGGKKAWDRLSCPNCYNALSNERQKNTRNLKRKADKEELTGMWRQMRKTEQNNDKLLFGSSDAVEKLLNQMNDVEEADTDVQSEGEEVLTL